MEAIKQAHTAEQDFCAQNALQGLSFASYGYSESVPWTAFSLRLRNVWALYGLWTKRGLDILGATVGLLLASPVLILAALAVRLTSPGKIFFAQERVGRGGRSFRMFKFRSMRVGADAEKAQLAALNECKDGPIFKIRRDPRITAVGRLLRKLSIDELPQLWNVLRGDMSLVGPRPAVPQEVAQYTARQRQRLMATPGLTCFWQVMGRSDLSFEKQVELDIRYIESRNIWLDIKLLVLTIPAVITGRGAY